MTRLSKGQWVGVGMAVVGIILAVVSWAIGDGQAFGGTAWIVGVGIALVIIESTSVPK